MESSLPALLNLCRVSSPSLPCSVSRPGRKTEEARASGLAEAAGGGSDDSLAPPEILDSSLDGPAGLLPLAMEEASLGTAGAAAAVSAALRTGSATSAAAAGCKEAGEEAGLAVASAETAAAAAAAFSAFFSACRRESKHRQYLLVDVTVIKHDIG